MITQLLPPSKGTREKIIILKRASSFFRVSNNVNIVQIGITCLLTSRETGKEILLHNRLEESEHIKELVTAS